MIDSYINPFAYYAFAHQELIPLSGLQLRSPVLLYNQFPLRWYNAPIQNEENYVPGHHQPPMLLKHKMVHSDAEVQAEPDDKAIFLLRPIISPSPSTYLERNIGYMSASLCSLSAIQVSCLQSLVMQFAVYPAVC